MVKLVRRSNSLTILVTLLFHSLASPFRSFHYGCTDCQTVRNTGSPIIKSPARQSNHASHQPASVRNEQEVANISKRDETIIVSDATVDGQSGGVFEESKATSYCDDVSESMFGNKSLYCVDHNYCPTIDDESSEKVRQLTCGIKHDGSIRVCCNVLVKSPPTSRNINDDATHSETLVVTDPPPNGRGEAWQQQQQHDGGARSANNSADDTVIVRSADGNQTTKPKDVVVSRRKFPRDCGLTKYSENQYETRIIGGEAAQRNAWPWFALIMFQRRAAGHRSPECGGTLISDRFVLTAAHCLLEQSRLTKPVRLAQVSVRLGEYDLKRSDGEIEMGAARIIVHPEFNPKTFKNDIGLIELDGRVSFGESVAPACLPHDNQLMANKTPTTLEGQLAWVIGFGQTSYNGRTSDQLRQVDLKIFEQAKCKRAFAHLTRITSEYVCASSQEPPEPAADDAEGAGAETKSSRKQAKDSCKGDSGGPLLMQVPSSKSSSRWYVYGIVSFGYKCATVDFPGVYTRVNFYLDWIESYL